MIDIVKSITRVTEMTAEITAASREQTAGIEPINHAVTQMDNVTQQNASLVEKASAAAMSLQDQAASLSQVVSVFKLTTGEAGHPPAPGPVRPRRVTGPKDSKRPATSAAGRHDRVVRLD